MAVHVIFAMRPGERGHLNAALALARRLRNAGLEVSFIGSRGEKDYLAEQGFSLKVINDLVCAEDIRCDLLIVDYAMPKAILVAIGLDQPFMALSTTLPASGNFPPFWSAATADGSLRSRLLIKALWAAEKCVAAPLRHLKLLHSPELAPWKNGLANICRDAASSLKLVRKHKLGYPLLVACPEAFEFGVPAKSGANTVSYIEPCADLGREEPRWSWPDFGQGDVRICAAFGSEQQEKHAPVIRSLIAVLRKRQDWRLVIANNPGSIDLSDLPKNVMVCHTVPQIQVLGLSTIMITHCGLNSVKEAVSMGVPLIGVPARRDQPSIGARIAYHHLGRIIGDNPGADTLESVIEDVSYDDVCSANIKRMQEIFNRYADDAPGCALIEKIARQNHAENRHKVV